MDNQNEYPIVLAKSDLVSQNQVEFVSNLGISGYSGAEQCLVKKNAKYYVVSTNVIFGRLETLVFPSDSEGNITSYGDVAGGYDMSREEAIKDLANMDVESVEIDNG